MIDHVTLNVTDLARSRVFYEQALAPLGYEVVKEFLVAAGFGQKETGKPDFWVVQREPLHTKVHVAFGCPSRHLVDAFYTAAIAAGGEDNGPPGIREMYHPDYYGAFVLDPDGNNVEAVCRQQE
jgi:catechol 2,3-dioxygenase-like lactoylglutathione lyase family enzyme